MNPSGFLDFHATKMLHTADGQQLLDIGFQLQKGNILALYGPSGAGKTTLLRILAGLLKPTTGHIHIAGLAKTTVDRHTEIEVWLDTANQIDLPTRHRSIGMVFQDFALFPHLTVRQQLQFALPKNQDNSIVNELLTMMELEELQHHKPVLLSGGQQQRVALARAIARRPKLLLLDEPLSALDDEMRYKLQDFILKAHQTYNLTTILVSHYLPDIIRLADQVIVLEKGLVRKQGVPSGIFLENKEKIGNQFKATGEIIDISPAGMEFRIRVLSGNSIIEVVVTPTEITRLHIGQKIILTSQTFNPVILPAT